MKNAFPVSQNWKSNEDSDHGDVFPAVSVHVETKDFKPKLQQFMTKISESNCVYKKNSRNFWRFPSLKKKHLQVALYRKNKRGFVSRKGEKNPGNLN